MNNKKYIFLFFLFTRARTKPRAPFALATTAAGIFLHAWRHEMPPYNPKKKKSRFSPLGLRLLFAQKKTPLKFAKRILPLRGRGYVKEGGNRKMDEIERALEKYGIPETKIGARYLYLGLKRAKESDDKEMIFNLSKKFYPRISEEICLQPKTIETSIRRAVQLSPYFPNLTVHDIIVEIYKEIEPNFFSLATAARTAAPAAWRAKRDERQKTR